MKDRTAGPEKANAACNSVITQPELLSNAPEARQSQFGHVPIRAAEHATAAVQWRKERAEFSTQTQGIAEVETGGQTEAHTETQRGQCQTVVGHEHPGGDIGTVKVISLSLSLSFSPF
jgi:hypothetical protein